MKPICWQVYLRDTPRGFWFRVFGYGLAVSDLPPLFSERNGYTRKLRIGRWGITLLTRRQQGWRNR